MHGARLTNWHEFETGGREARQRTSLGPRPKPLTDWRGQAIKPEREPQVGGEPKPEEGHYVTRERGGLIGAFTYLQLEANRAKRQATVEPQPESTEEWLKRHKIGKYAEVAR